MARKVTLFRSVKGLNNAVDPSRLEVNFKTGEVELAAAYNADIDSTGRIGRRRGFVQKRSDDAHSGFCDGGDCLYVSGSSLYRLNLDYSRDLLRSDLTLNARMSYVQVADSIYYANDFQKGIVPQGGSDTTWMAAEYQGPETRKLYHDPPIGHLLAFFGSSILVAKGNVIYPSEKFQYTWFRRYGFAEADRITLMQPVKGGLFISTASKIFFYEGDSVDKMKRYEVANYGAIEGTVSKCQGSLLNLDIPEVFLWATSKGICIGADNGLFKNITEQKLVYPSTNRGCGVVNNHTYLVLLEE